MAANLLKIRYSKRKVTLIGGIVRAYTSARAEVYPSPRLNSDVPGTQVPAFVGDSHRGYHRGGGGWSFELRPEPQVPPARRRCHLESTARVPPAMSSRPNEVAPDSPAERVGIHKGDEVLAINGVRLRNSWTSREFWRGSAPGDRPPTPSAGMGSSSRSPRSSSDRRRAPATLFFQYPVGPRLPGHRAVHLFPPQQRL